MNKRRIRDLVLVLFGLFILNSTIQSNYLRIDLTKDGRYTLSEATNSILNEVKGQLIIRVYLEGEFPSEFQRLQIETRQYLEELKAKNSNIKIRFVDPSGREDQLVRSGMYPSELTVQENGKLSNAIIFPWAEVIYKRKRELVSLLPDGIVQSQKKQL